MKKNLFNFLLGGAFLLSAPMLTSCEDILGEWDRPTPVTPSGGGSSGATGTYIVYTAPGTSSSVAIPSTATAWNFTTGNVPAGTYYVEGSFTSTGALVLQGEVNLILKDGATLTVDNGIGSAVDGSYNFIASLNVYAQSTDPSTMGQLIVNNASGGDEPTAVVLKSLTIHGGQISATGDTNNTGTNGSYGIETGTGKVIIYDGIISATGKKGVPGIGTWGIGGGIDIYGGTVTATGGDGTATVNGGAGINSNECILTVNGGEVIATGGATGGAGAGKGVDYSSGGISLGTGITLYQGDAPNPTDVVSTTPIACTKRYVEIR